MKKLFGTDGMRGVAGRFPLDSETIETVGRSLTKHLSRRLGRAPRIVTGRDTRESGVQLERAFIAGAQKEQAVCQSAGIITTPGVAFLTRALGADAGVVLSASHNPFEDNGVKIFAPDGRKIADEMERLIEADIYAAPRASRAATQDDFRFVEETDANAAALQARYLDYLCETVGADLNLNGVRIVADCAHGAAYALAPKMLTRLGAIVRTMNDAPDGRNINRNCGSLHLENLQRVVVETEADAGVGYDGDADRALFVDARGAIVDGDAVLWVMAQFFDARGAIPTDKRFVVATVMSNIGLERALATRGIALRRTDVGDKNVLDELLRTGGILGGEQSGHIIFPRESRVGDGLITTIHLLRAMRESGKPLGELTEGFVRYPQILVNVRVREKMPFADVPQIIECAHEIEAALGDRGRLLLRYSGTEPLARVMIEGEDQSQIEAFAQKLAQTIASALGGK